MYYIMAESFTTGKTNFLQCKKMMFKCHKYYKYILKNKKYPQLNITEKKLKK